MRYCIWNNKGGVGKTFLTYCMATEYAIQHPEKNVVVVDMCPQANISEMLLGGDGLGEDNLQKLHDNSRTIASYIMSRFDRSQFGKLGNEIAYFVKVNDFNQHMPQNLYLLPGDIDLDLCSTIIDYLASSPRRDSWERSRSLLKDLLEVFDESTKTNKTYFIDTNPSFANYTQLGIVTSDRIVIPCTADSASIRGIYNILRLVFGVKDDRHELSNDIFDTFSSRLQAIGVPLPKIHAFVLNKARTIDRSASKAYEAHVHNIKKLASSYASQYSDCFTPEETDRIFEMKDCNTLSPIMNYNGIAPSSLHAGYYNVYDIQAQANRNQIDPFLENLNRIIKHID